MKGQADTGVQPVRPDAVPLARRRRLSPLETAAAVAIILSCLVATAMMTGILPHAPHAVSNVPGVPLASGSAAAVPQGSPEVVTAPVAATGRSGSADHASVGHRRNATVLQDGTAPMVGGDVIAGRSGDLAQQPSALAETALPATVPASLPPKESSTVVRSAVATGATATVATAATGATVASGTIAANTAAANARRRRTHAAHQRQHHHESTALPSRGKSREEVVAELLRAKRDGSYSSAMEAYR